MPVSKKAHQTQFPATPLVRTISVTRLGVSAEKVVATIEIPKSHQGILRPDKKKSVVLLPAERATQSPTAKVSPKNKRIIHQSKEVNCIILMI